MTNDGWAGHTGRDLASAIREERVRRGLTQEVIAGQMRLYYGLEWWTSTVAKIETGTRTLTAAELLALTGRFGTAWLDEILAQRLDSEPIELPDGDIGIPVIAPPGEWGQAAMSRAYAGAYKALDEGWDYRHLSDAYQRVVDTLAMWAGDEAAAGRPPTGRRLIGKASSLWQDEQERHTETTAKRGKR